MAKKKSRWQEWGWLFVAIAISIVVALMLLMAQFRFQIANSLVLIGLLPIFPLGFIAIDLVTYGIRKKENTGQNPEVKMN
jgi:ABC-type transport system involved in cytochrome bd biosynthesis fused ATPase/permease subunit